MIIKATTKDENELAMMLGVLGFENSTERILKNSIDNDVFLMQIKTLFMCYKTGHPSCNFYFVYPNSLQESKPENYGEEIENSKENNNYSIEETVFDGEKTGVLCVQGKSAIYAGPLQDSEEIELFLNTLEIDYFKSNNMLLYNFDHLPMYSMCLKAGVFADVYACEIQENPDLWKLAHSGVLTDIDADAFYGDAVKRTQNGFADIRAVRIITKSGGVEYVATAAVYTHIGKNVYITDVETKENYRGKGYASTLLSTLARAYAGKDLHVVCMPKLEHFYEQLGFVFLRPVCVCKRK